jgi:hypothetical protein
VIWVILRTFLATLKTVSFFLLPLTLTYINTLLFKKRLLVSKLRIFLFSFIFSSLFRLEATQFKACFVSHNATFFHSTQIERLQFWSCDRNSDARHKIRVSLKNPFPLLTLFQATAWTTPRFLAPPDKNPML